MFRYNSLQNDTRDVLSGILLFMITVPLAMASHWYAHFYGIMYLTITGWLFATLGAIRLGMVITNPRLWNILGQTNAPRSA